MTNADKTARFIRQLTAHQNALHAYIYSLLPDHDLSQDVLQDTNELVWRKADEFAEGTNFLAWACTIARYKVLECRRASQRDRLLFDDELVGTLASEAEEDAATESELLARRTKALRECLETVPPRQRQLIQQRYQPGASVASVAADAGLDARGLSVTLHRTRRALLKCMEQRLGEETDQ